MDLVISPDDPRAKDVRKLLEDHLAFSTEVTPAGHVHVLDLQGLLDPAIILFSARLDGVLAGVGALRRLHAYHAEIKSIHTSREVRGQGIGRAMVEHILAVASNSGYERVSLETGTMDAFTPARTLYAKVGFQPCEPFGEYTANPHSICMAIQLIRP